MPKKKQPESKPWYKSKTIWINTLTVIGGVTAWAVGELQSGAPVTMLGVINAVVRVYTKKVLTK